MMKKLFSLLIVCLCVLFNVSSCKDSNTIQIGILQEATHGALNELVDGFKSVIKESGENIKIVVKNPEGDPSLRNSFAASLARENDLVLGVGTNSAASLKHSVKVEGSNKPVLFGAVTDPVSANLVKSFDEIENVTGLSDKAPIESQIALIKQIDANIKTVGIIYNNAEPNSKVQADQVEELLKKENINVKVRSVSETSNIGPTISALVRDNIETLYIPTDNMMASNMSIIKDYCLENNILMIAGEEELVNQGAHASYSISYRKMGEELGKMALDILVNKKDVKTIKTKFMDLGKCNLIVNEESFKKTGHKIPEEK